jgi:hypothetical protein
MRLSIGGVSLQHDSCVADHGLGIQVMTNRKLKKKKSKNLEKELAEEKKGEEEKKMKKD